MKSQHAGKRAIQAVRLSVKVEGQTGLESQDQNTRSDAIRDGYVIVGTAAEYAKGPSDPFRRRELGPWLTDPDKIITYDIILAAKVDRLSRSMRQAMRLREWCENHGKVLIVSSPPLQWPPRNQGEKQMWVLLEMLAEAEWDAASGRYKEMKTFLKSVNAAFGRPPYGYRVTGDWKSKTMVPTEAGRKYIAEIFRRYISGDSLQKIANWLAGAGAESPQHAAWSLQHPDERGDEPASAWWPRSVALILKNPAYAGRVCEYKRVKDPVSGLERLNRHAYGRVIHEVEALVDEGIWTLAQRTLAARVKYRSGRISDHPAMLSGGAVTCAGCGAPMYRTAGRVTEGKIKYYYYRCWGRGSRRVGCGKVARCDQVDQHVNLAIGTRTDPVTERCIVPGNDHQKEIDKVQFALQQLAAEGLDRAEYRKRSDELYDRLEALQAMDPEPDRVMEVSTGRTFAQMWGSLSTAERGPWLKKMGFRIFATAEWTAVYDWNGLNWLVAGDAPAGLQPWLAPGALPAA
jgi:site-specific DNA recombinase